MRKWYPALLVAAATVASVIAYPRLPERVPTHWGAHNEVNGYSSRLVAAVMLPVIIAALWGLLRALPLVDPRRQNYAKFQSAYDLVVSGVLTLMTVLHVVILGAALGYPVDIARVVPAAVGVLFILVGNVLPQARPNWWFGIRTPWTMSNDRVWERTHRVGGYLFVAAGMIMIVSVLLPPQVAAPAVPVIVCVAAFGSVVYSLIAWKQETSR